MASSAPTDGPVPPRDDQARRGSAPAATPSPARRHTTTTDGHAQRTLLFEVGGRTYGCGIDAVREIIPFRRTTRLPGAPSFVCGLINLRGTIVTVLDLAERLGTGRVDRENGSIVLAELGSKVVGVAVDRVRDVQPVAPEQVEAARGDEAGDEVVRGLVHLDGDVVVLLDVQRLVRQVLAQA